MSAPELFLLFAIAYLQAGLYCKFWRYGTFTFTTRNTIEIGMPMHVLFNGVRESDVIEANVFLQRIVRYSTPYRVHNGVLTTETAWGRVELVPYWEIEDDGR